MLEQALTELFERQTSADPPPMRASVAQATSDGQALRSICAANAGSSMPVFSISSR